MTFSVALPEDFFWVPATICRPVEVTGKQGPVAQPPVALPSEPGIESEQDNLEIWNPVRMRSNGPCMRTVSFLPLQ
ncbi:MAG: hypothetical protein HN891_08150 [Planctomycetes bacterium]|jgi:hypothetical protein|nr:hypothetical protein [Planctomycetota bacterium]MBT6453662.1 hypothetical protein [Planctomycetota bacterium]MBT6540217.1 hypothetical protein [Planctomycetota bacterium]MBT6784129.1 hypothetical protein [Planctomycetota bacterium]MBT6969429.1 hypothetical protein [Planctomycetota bacterium]